MRHVITHHFPRTSVQSQCFALTRAFNETVVRNLGWEFYADEKQRVSDLNILREKSAIIHEVLDGIPGGDEVLWIDGDVLLVGNRIGDIFSYLGSEGDFGMCRIDGRLNSGVIPMNVNPAIRELWKEILYHERQDSKPVINELIRQNIYDLLLDADLPGAAYATLSTTQSVSDGGSYKVKLIELPSMWNQSPTHITTDAQIIGYHGYDAYSKLRLIRKELEVRHTVAALGNSERISS
jgi:hypothetical protein